MDFINLEIILMVLLALSLVVNLRCYEKNKSLNEIINRLKNDNEKISRNLAVNHRILNEIKNLIEKK